MQAQTHPLLLKRLHVNTCADTPSSTNATVDALFFYFALDICPSFGNGYPLTTASLVSHLILKINLCSAFRKNAFMCVSACEDRCLETKTGVRAPETAVSYCTWVLGTDLLCSGRPECTANTWATTSGLYIKRKQKHECVCVCVFSLLPPFPLSWCWA